MNTITVTRIGDHLFAGAYRPTNPCLRCGAWQDEAESMPCSPRATKPVAVLSTTVLPKDGVYEARTLPAGEIPDLSGVPHYIGHPDTKSIVEGLGAVPAPSKLFEGLEVGEAAVCFPIAQGKSTRATEGFTNPHQNVVLGDLQIRVITRLG